MKQTKTPLRERTIGRFYPAFYLASLFFLDFFFRVFHSDVSVVDFRHAAPNVFTLSWTLVLAAIAYVLPGVAKRFYMGVTLAVFSFLPLVHAVLYHVSGTFLTFSDLAFAETGASFLSIQYLTIRWQIYLFTVLSLALGVFSIVIAPKKNAWSMSKFAAVVLVFVGGFTGVLACHSVYDADGTGDRFEWTDTFDPHSIEGVYAEFNDANVCLMLCGNYQYAFRSITISLRDAIDLGTNVKKLDEYFAEHPKTLEANEKTGLYQDKNCICILLESIDTWMLTEEFMPNLYRLKTQSIDFVNHYTPLYLSAGTFNTEFAMNCGFYLPVSGTSARTYATNVYPQSIASLFRSAGYTANSYHSLDGRFYNRQVVHLQWGYESFNDHNNLKLQGDKTCDTTLMEEYSYNQIVHDEKFFSYLITYSGHGPYNEKRAVISDPHIEKAKELAKNSGITSYKDDTYSQFEYAIAHALETDAMVGELMRRLEEDGHIHDTTLVFFTDHYSKYLTDVGFVMDLKQAYDGNMLCHTPFFIWSEGGEYEAVEKATASVDMLPTVLNLFGIPYDPTFLLGDDAFSDRGGIVMFKDYSWYDGTVYWTPEFDGVETEEILEKCRLVRQTIQVSWNVVRTNFFAKTS